MNIATIEVSGTYARIGRYVTIPAGIVGAEVDFRFTDDLWAGLQKTVVFRSSVTRDVLLTGTVAVIPHETVAKPGDTLYVGVYGVDADNNLVVPTLWTGIGGVRDAADPSGDPGTDPTLPIWAQLKQDVEDLKQGGGGPGSPGEPGADGGYYTPAVTQPEKNKIQFDFTPSKSDMPAVQPVQVKLPAGEGSGGNVDPVEASASGTNIILNNSMDESLRGMKIFGKTVQNGTPTPESPAELVSPGNDGSLTVSIGVSASDKAPQTVAISTPNGMLGVPVASGGNYTDASGQQWICDEVDFTKGVYIQRVGKATNITFQIAESNGYPAGDSLMFLGWLPAPANTYTTKNRLGLCNKLPYDASNLLKNDITGFYFQNARIYCRIKGVSDTDTFISLMEGNEFIVPLEPPIETALSTAELEAYASLHTYYPSTTITNDGFANMEVSYMASGNVSSDESHEFKDYWNYGIPVLSLFGDTADMSKDNAVTMNYEYQGRNGKCAVKWQGSSSLAYPKKNYTVEFDTAFEAKEGWGEQQKYCLKANFIDATHARNLVSAKLWSRIVSTRGDGLFDTLPQHGAVDGFPVVVEINGEFSGLYTFNIPKDGWMFGLSDSSLTQAIVCAEGKAANSTCAFKELANLDGNDFSLEYVSDENNADWVKTSLNRLITACMNSDGSDLDTTVAQYLDWQSAIDFYVFNTLIGAYDCIEKNYLLVTLDGTKWYFSAYDTDSTFGLEWTGKGFRYPHNTQPTPSTYSMRHKVMELIATHKKDALKARCDYIRKNVIPEYMVHGDFYNFASAIPRIVLEEDWRKWPSIPNTSSNTIAQVMDWYRTRIELMDAEMEAL